MEKSILNSIKKMIGPTVEDKYFDSDIIIHINSVFGVLKQLGVGSEAGFSIKDESAVWSDFIGESTDIDDVISYMYLRVKLLFDPPLNASVIASMEKTISELEWRLSVAVDTKE